MGFWAELYERVEPADAGIWHPWYIFSPFTRDIEGNLILRAHVWRRYKDGRWEYQRRESDLYDYD